MIQWHAHLHPVLTGALILAAAGWCRMVYRRMLTRMPPRRARFLIAPKAALLVLLLAALFQPSWVAERQASRARLLLLLDTSASMQTPDGGASRLERAWQSASGLAARLDTRFDIEPLRFDTALRPLALGDPMPTPEGGTDLGACLARLAARDDIRSFTAVVILTDGGDEPLDAVRLPPVPVSVVAAGASRAAWHDVAVDSVSAPASAETATEFEILADLEASRGTDPDFAAALARVPVRLERETPAGWQPAGEAHAALTHGRARASFRVEAGEPGIARFRVTAGPLPGEVSILNNTRPFAVDVTKKALHVLYFTRELGMDFKLLRAELARDPGIAFTALIRTLGERFVVQGERFPGDDELEAGFPADPRTLDLYDCIVLGSFPASDWTDGQARALLQFVEHGGGLILLGGDQSFGRGGYARSPLAPLFPWTLADDEPALRQGLFPVSIPAQAAAHPVVASLAELLAGERESAVESLNAVGDLKPGAQPLLNAAAGSTLAPMAAVQAFGRGRTLALASNTLWRWARKSQRLADAYGLFVRQAVRHAAGQAEGGRLLAIRWDREHYRPGDEALVSITLAGREAAGTTRLSASLASPSDTHRLAVEPQPGVENAFAIRLLFAERGEHTFKLAAERDGATVESYARAWQVAPLVPEGARLAVDEEALARLAARSGGLYARTDSLADIAGRLEAARDGQAILVEKPLFQSWPWFVLAALCLFLLEWILRRRFFLV